MSELQNLKKDQEEKNVLSDVKHSIMLSNEFFSAVITGGVMGFYIDKLFNISPWGLIVFLFLGFSAGIWSVLRSNRLISVNTIDDKNTSREIKKA